MVAAVAMPPTEGAFCARASRRRLSLCRETLQKEIDMAGAIVKFEELPANTRALLLARLAMALRTQNTASINPLVRTRDIDVVSLWRSICRKAKQPVCTIPSDAIGPE